MCLTLRSFIFYVNLFFWIGYKHSFWTPFQENEHMSRPTLFSHGPTNFYFYFKTSVLKRVWHPLQPRIIKTTYIDILCWNISPLCWVPQSYSHVLSNVTKTHKIHRYHAWALNVIFTSSNHRFYVIIKRVSTNIAMTCAKKGHMFTTSTIEKG